MCDMNPQHLCAQIALRAWPFPRGAGRIIDRFFSKLEFTNAVEDVSTTDGFKMRVMPNDLIGRHIYLTGEFDRSIVEMLCTLARPGDTLLDVGANIGYVSACFLANVPESRVIAVEPQPNIVGLLRQNLSQFGTSRYQVAPAALSGRTSSGWLQPCPKNPGAGRLVEAKTAGSISVDLWSAERLFSFANIDKLDLVKIDVEGHEEEVIGACAEAFKAFRPRAILFESSPDRIFRDGGVWSILHAIGYNIFGLKKRLTRLDLPRINRASDCVFNDYVAISRQS
jgi:FkbM family methyltransferase